ncbi:MAG: M20/M25/M40 family metallo-hydrolase [Gemmatimonas sp.]
MRAIRVLVLVGLASCHAAVVPSGPIPLGIQTDVSFVASPRQEGRAVGSSGSNRVAEYIVQRYKSLGLEGAFRLTCGTAAPACGDGFYQPFTGQNARNAKNVGAIIVGSDPSVRGEYIVIGAHYDHVGRSATLSLDPEKRDEIRPGADDNGSGTVAVMELGRRLAEHPPRRSILLLHFDAEELGLIGSSAFVNRPPVTRGQIRFMLNLDMVGRLRDGGLEIDKSTLMYDDPPLLAVLDSAARALNMKHSFTNEIGGRSDHANFRRIDVSAIALFTGFHNDYHRTTDVVAKLDLRGIGSVTDVAEAVVRFAADRK